MLTSQKVIDQPSLKLRLGECDQSVCIRVIRGKLWLC